MSHVLLHDSSRPGALGWATAGITAGFASGVIISPFATPRTALPRQPRAIEVVARIHAEGGTVYFDPTTHGVLAPAADNFATYDTWGLWQGQRAALTRPALLRHVERTLTVGASLGVQVVAPTLPLDMPTGHNAEVAIEMAEAAVEQDPNAMVAIIGSSGFWASGGALDAHVGQLVSLRPAGWSVTVTRPSLNYPWPGIDPEEVAGMCRTVHSLSLRGDEVIAANCDLAGLPLVAAGASWVGSGWDLRQRMCAEESFRIRTGMARSSPRVTHRLLLASLRREEAERLNQADAALSTRLVSGVLPSDQNEHWRHHLRVLSSRADRVLDAGDRQARAQRLGTMYQGATIRFDQVSALIGRLTAGREQWITQLAAGLALYSLREGW